MKKSVLLLMGFIFIGCDSNENREITTLKDNTWIGQYCAVVTQFDQDGKPHHTYYKSLYRFNDRLITAKVSEYSDKDCKNSLNKYSDYNLTYYNLGLKENKNSYQIYDIKIEEDLKEQDAFYAINKNKLCLSKSIYGVNIEENLIDSNGNKYTFTESGLHIYPSRDNIIDYTNCLVKK